MDIKLFRRQDGLVISLESKLGNWSTLTKWVKKNLLRSRIL